MFVTTPDSTPTAAATATAAGTPHRTIPTVIFLGSFQQYSAVVLEALLNSPLVQVVAVVTTPPQLHPKTKLLIKNPVQLLAEKHTIPCLTPDTLPEPAALLPTQPDILYTAGYGKLLPESWLRFPTVAALNLHFSLLPKYRGANPAEWALLLGETETCVSIIEMSPEFDTGSVLAQATVPLLPTDTRVTTYQKLYELGGHLSPTSIAEYVAAPHTGTPQQPSPTPYAKRFTRDDSFVSWELLNLCMAGNNDQAKTALTIDPHHCGPLLFKAYQAALALQPSLNIAVFLERATRALAEFPSVWTKIPTAKGTKRMKLISVAVQSAQLTLTMVQIEGQQPALWNQVRNSVTA
jgi:methionyl-tRNA formyltransferase